MPKFEFGPHFQGREEKHYDNGAIKVIRWTGGYGIYIELRHCPKGDYWIAMMKRSRPFNTWNLSGKVVWGPFSQWIGKFQDRETGERYLEEEHAVQLLD